MLETIKRFTASIFVILLVFVLLLTLGFIWGSMTHELAKEMLLKVSYTLGAVYAFSLIVIYLSFEMGKKNK